MRVIRALLFLLCTCPLLAEGGARTWTLTSGETVEATFIKLEGGQVHLRGDGEILRLELGELCADDRAVVDEKSRHGRAADLPIKLDQKISGPTLHAADLAGRPIVIHQWQAHCGTCPPTLAAFEKLAGRRGKKAAYLIWHFNDPAEMAKDKSRDLDLKLPVYHGSRIPWDDKFGEVAWPHVVLVSAQGEIVYMGKQDKAFDKALKKATAD